ENTSKLLPTSSKTIDPSHPDESSPAPDQGTQLADAIRLAYCQPGVGAFFNFMLADETDLAGWQSGLLWADRTRRPSFVSFAPAIQQVRAGTVNCSTLKGGIAGGMQASLVRAGSRQP